MLYLRLACYVVAVAAALVVIGRLYGVPHHLARMLIVAMVTWAVNAALLLLLLFARLRGVVDPAWSDWALTVNAVLVAASPVLLCVVLTWRPAWRK